MKNVKVTIEKPTKEQIQKVEDALAHRRADTATLVYVFNDKHRNSLVYLKVCSDGNSFQIHLGIYDRFVNNRYYDEGTAVAYFSDALYEEIQAVADEMFKGNRKVHWNNTASTGWLSINE